MPLDGHSYLVSQGWAGKGTALRQGAISRPLTIPQKRNLAGLGKDRDEAFPFWDHLFSAAAKSIKVKLKSDDSDEDNGHESKDSTTTTFKRTETGILSNRRPTTGTPVTSGTSTPDSTSTQQYGLLVAAKREAAKRGLYSRFFRGPVLGPNSPLEQRSSFHGGLHRKVINDNIVGEEIDVVVIGGNTRTEFITVNAVGTEGEVEEPQKKWKMGESSATEQGEKTRLKEGKKAEKDAKQGVKERRAAKRRRENNNKEEENATNSKKKKSSKGKQEAEVDEEQGGDAAKDEITRLRKKRKESKEAIRGREKGIHDNDDEEKKRKRGEGGRRREEKARKKAEKHSIAQAASHDVDPSLTGDVQPATTQTWGTEKRMKKRKHREIS